MLLLNIEEPEGSSKLDFLILFLFFLLLLFSEFSISMAPEGRGVIIFKNQKGLLLLGCASWKIASIFKYLFCGGVASYLKSLHKNEVFT